MSFAHPWWLLALGLLPLWVYFRRRGWGSPAALRFPETLAVQHAFRGGRPIGSGAAETARLFTLGCLVVVFAQPSLRKPAGWEQNSGVDLVVVQDISGSMLAQDFAPQTRLQAAQAALRNFLSREKNNRIGLVVFAAQAYWACPLTFDYTTLLQIVDGLEIGGVPDGTAIGLGLATAINHLKDSPARRKAIVLLTDGRENAGRLSALTAAELAGPFQIRIYTIGLGKPEGAPIVLASDRGQEIWIREEDGSVHLEGVDEDLLRRVARQTGGKFFRASEPRALSSIYAEIQRMETVKLAAKTFRRGRDVGSVGLWLVLASLCWEGLVAFTGKKALP